MIRGVVFDLWNTLATWPEDESQEFRRRWSRKIGIDPEELDAVWYAPGAYEKRESGPIATALASVHAAFARRPGRQRGPRMAPRDGAPHTHP